MFFSLVVSFLSPSACFWFCRFPRWKAFATLTSEWPGRGADKTASTFPALVQTKAFPPPEGSPQRVLPRQTTISLLNREDQAVSLFLSFFFCGSPNRSRRRIRATTQRFLSVARPFLHPGRIASGMSEFRAARTRLLECVDRNGGEKMANNEEAAGADTTKKERNAPQNCPEHCIAVEALD